MDTQRQTYLKSQTMLVRNAIKLSFENIKL